MWAAPRTLVALFGVTEAATRVALATELLSTIVSHALTQPAAAGAAPVLDRVLRAAPVTSCCRRGSAGRAFHCELVRCAAAVVLACAPPVPTAGEPGSREAREAAAAVRVAARAWSVQAMALVMLELHAHQAWVGDTEAAGNAVLSVAVRAVVLSRAMPGNTVSMCSASSRVGA